MWEDTAAGNRHTYGESRTGGDVGRYCSREQTYIQRVTHRGRQEKMWEDTAAENRHTYGESRTGGDRRRCGKILQQGTDIHTESHTQGETGEDVGRYCSREQTYIRRVTHRRRCGKILCSREQTYIQRVTHRGRQEKMWEDTAAGNRHTYGESHTGGDRRRCGKILQQGTDIHTESHTQGEKGEDVGRYCSREQTYIRRVTHRRRCGKILCSREQTYIQRVTHRGRQEKNWEDTAAGNRHTYGESRTGGDVGRYCSREQTYIRRVTHRGRQEKNWEDTAAGNRHTYGESRAGGDRRRCGKILQQGTDIHTKSHAQGRQEKMWEDTAAGNRHTYGESRTGGDRRRCGKILQQGTDIHTESHTQGETGEDVGRYCSREQTYIRRVMHRGRQEKMWEYTAAGNRHTYGESHAGGDRRRCGKILQQGTDIHMEVDRDVRV